MSILKKLYALRDRLGGHNVLTTLLALVGGGLLGVLVLVWFLGGFFEVFGLRQGTEILIGWALFVAFLRFMKVKWSNIVLGFLALLIFLLAINNYKYNKYIEHITEHPEVYEY